MNEFGFPFTSQRPADILFPERKEAKATNTCVACKGDATTFKDAISKREYELSHLCQKCQDNFFD